MSRHIDVYALCGISSNQSTAYRVLHVSVLLNKDDVVIYDRANRACGQNVIQVAKYLAIKVLMST